MRKGNWLAGLGLLGACALCCALPLIGGAAALGVSSFFVDPLIIAGLAITLGIAGWMVYQRRKAAGSACMKQQGCGCNSCAVK